MSRAYEVTGIWMRLIGNEFHVILELDEGLFGLLADDGRVLFLGERWLSEIVKLPKRRRVRSSDRLSAKPSGGNQSGDEK
jgi:hypothetical protein